MLPDFPKEKNKIVNFFSSYVELKKKQLSPLFSSIPKVRIFEGNKQKLVREDGSIEETEYKRFESGISYSIQEIE
ncbi:unnamed protein product, partial [marine sediment metagenome]